MLLNDGTKLLRQGAFAPLQQLIARNDTILTPKQV
jgi:hypothetical protein